MPNMVWAHFETATAAPTWNCDGDDAQERDTIIVRAFISGRYRGCSMWLADSLSKSHYTPPPGPENPRTPTLYDADKCVGATDDEIAARPQRWNGATLGAALGLTRGDIDAYKHGSTLMPGDVWCGLLARCRTTIGVLPPPTLSDRACLGYAEAFHAIYSTIAKDSGDAAAKRVRRYKYAAAFATHWAAQELRLEGRVLSTRALESRFQTITALGNSRLRLVVKDAEMDERKLIDGYLQQTSLVETVLHRLAHAVAHRWGIEWTSTPGIAAHPQKEHQ